MSTRKRKDAYLYRVGDDTQRHLFKQPAELHYATKSELADQVKQYARGVWTTAGKIDVDTRSQEILVDGEVRAKYALHEPREAHDATGALL